jgi:hypothetical protein
MLEFGKMSLSQATMNKLPLMYISGDSHKPSNDSSKKNPSIPAYRNGDISVTGFGIQ